MNDLCAVFAGGEFVNADCISKEVVEGKAYVISADRGYELASACHIHSDLVIGDFDSADRIPQNENVKIYPVEKDDTDLMLALREGLAKGCKIFEIYGAVGGRLDHMLGNIQSLMFLAANGAMGIIISDREIVRLLPSGEYKIPYKKDYSLSLIAYSEKVENLTVSGTKYTVENFTLENNFPIGISNKILLPDDDGDGYAHIRFDKGYLLVVQSYLFTKL
jgi:thiamine pyrophosphokinase